MFGIDDAIAAGLGKTQQCRVCCVVKDAAEFNYRPDTGRLRTECKKCHSSRNKRYYQDNSAFIKELSKQYRAEDQRRHLYSSVKQSARQKNLEFTLEPCDIQIPEKCPYLGTTLTNIQGFGRIYSNASVDRIDSKRGYTKDNIQIVSVLANTMKNSASIEELKTFAKNVLKLHGGE